MALNFIPELRERLAQFLPVGLLAEPGVYSPMPPPMPRRGGWRPGDGCPRGEWGRWRGGDSRQKIEGEGSSFSWFSPPTSVDVFEEEGKGKHGYSESNKTAKLC